ncbi:hypothetical protein [uncultured Bacteroides sp.]|uniref:hypothetical protein n=1 Tax=uncultured Bacteroides sp. TaxID=162156 RepID=UPI0026244219|nr:hypothetical protein [uncultured Bacteroides sp.]
MFEENGIKYFLTPKEFYKFVMNYDGKLTLKIGMEICDSKTKKLIGKLIKKEKV